jgi:hypothetical protein
LPAPQQKAPWKPRSMLNAMGFLMGWMRSSNAPPKVDSV